MTAMLIHHMAPIMFASLVIFLLLGYPVAFSLAANGLIFGLIGIELGLFHPDFLQALPEQIYGIMNNDVLLAIPFFTFMGLVLGGPEWRRTCSIPSVSCLGLSAEGSPMPSFS